MSIDEANALLDRVGGPPTFKFETVGDTIKGTVVNAEVRQQKDYNTGEMLTWDDGSARLQLVVDIEQDDGETRRVYLKNQGLTATKKALDGAPLEVGARIGIQHTGVDAPRKAGMHGAKLFAVEYQAPTRAVDVGSIL